MHKNPDGSLQFTNALIHETSPYLLQHAHNPVNWLPWGADAFDQALKENKPVLLSVGYATCHWCHVMERESFEDLEIADFLNTHYVAIKVDREERPDIDAVFMASVQALTGQGGWPMTVWLTPEKKPFYAGTYFPPREGVRGARVGFLSALKKLHDFFTSEPTKLQAQTQGLIEGAKQQLTLPPEQTFDWKKTVWETFDWFKSSFDSRDGGFGYAPKFPRPAVLDFLLSVAETSKNNEALHMTQKTCLKMILGGIHDQLGGGFHRYSVDSHWLVPHFEKMLYDNAQLIQTFTALYKISPLLEIKNAISQTVNYLLKEMKHETGAFFSATDADSEGEEGKFFVWTKTQLQTLLGKDYDFFQTVYPITDQGNFEGHTILFRQKTFEDLFNDLGLSQETFFEKLKSLQSKLYEHRSKRIPPITDDKIITFWNGLGIAAILEAAWVLDETTWTQAALNALHFFEGQPVYRLQRKNKSASNPFQEDFAGLIEANLTAFRLTGLQKYFDQAMGLFEKMNELFWDATGGGYWRSNTSSELWAQEKPYYDGAEPSANALALNQMITFYQITSETRFLEQAEHMAKTFSGVMRHPHMSPLFVKGLMRLKGAQITVHAKGPLTKTWKEALVSCGSWPLVLCVPKTSSGDPLTQVQVCQGTHCYAPVTDPKELQKLINFIYDQHRYDGPNASSKKE